MTVTAATLAVVALSWWGPAAQQACPTGVTITSVPVFTTTDVDLDVAHGQTLTNIVASAKLNGCAIRLNRATYDRLDPVRRCSVIYHEVGHAALGLLHVDDPRDVMNALVPDSPRCIRLIDRLYAAADARRRWQRTMRRWGFPAWGRRLAAVTRATPTNQEDPTR